MGKWLDCLGDLRDPSIDEIQDAQQSSWSNGNRSTLLHVYEQLTHLRLGREFCLLVAHAMYVFARMFRLQNAKASPLCFLLISILILLRSCSMSNLAKIHTIPNVHRIQQSCLVWWANLLTSYEKRIAAPSMQSKTLCRKNVKNQTVRLRSSLVEPRAYNISWVEQPEASTSAFAKGSFQETSIGRYTSLRLPFLSVFRRLPAAVFLAPIPAGGETSSVSVHIFQQSTLGRITSEHFVNFPQSKPSINVRRQYSSMGHRLTFDDYPALRIGDLQQ